MSEAVGVRQALSDLLEVASPEAVPGSTQAERFGWAQGTHNDPGPWPVLMPDYNIEYPPQRVKGLEWAVGDILVMRQVGSGNWYIAGVIER